MGKIFGSKGRSDEEAIMEVAFSLLLQNQPHLEGMIGEIKGKLVETTDLFLKEQLQRTLVWILENYANSEQVKYVDALVQGWLLPLIVEQEAWDRLATMDLAAEMKYFMVGKSCEYFAFSKRFSEQCQENDALRQEFLENVETSHHLADNQRQLIVKLVNSLRDGEGRGYTMLWRKMVDDSGLAHTDAQRLMIAVTPIFMEKIAPQLLRDPEKFKRRTSEFWSQDDCKFDLLFWEQVLCEYRCSKDYDQLKTKLLFRLRDEE